MHLLTWRDRKVRSTCLIPTQTESSTGYNLTFQLDEGVRSLRETQAWFPALAWLSIGMRHAVYSSPLQSIPFKNSINIVGGPFNEHYYFVCRDLVILIRPYEIRVAILMHSEQFYSTDGSTWALETMTVPALKIWYHDMTHDFWVSSVAWPPCFNSPQLVCNCKSQIVLVPPRTIYVKFLLSVIFLPLKALIA